MRTTGCLHLGCDNLSTGWRERLSFIAAHELAGCDAQPREFKLAVGCRNSTPENFQSNHNQKNQRNKMSIEANGIKDSVDNITEDTRALLSATANSVDEKVVEARNRLNSVLSAAKETCVALQKKTVAGVKVADKSIRDNPYQAIGVALGVGALIGFLLSRRNK